MFACEIYFQRQYTIPYPARDKASPTHRPTCDNRAINEITFRATRVSGVRFGQALCQIRIALDMQNSRRLVHYEVALLNHDALMN